jgi:hypothetical protein
MGDVVNLPDGGRIMRGVTQLDGDQWMYTGYVLTDPLMRRRLVRTQTEELLALYQQYPLPEFESVRQLLTQMQQGYGDVAPYDHPLLAAMDDDPGVDDVA